MDRSPKRIKTESKKKRKYKDLNNTPKRRLIETNKKANYLENPYNIDITWDWMDLKIIICN